MSKKRKNLHDKDIEAFEKRYLKGAKETKQERKKMMAKDRSKFKKTDKDKKERQRRDLYEEIKERKDLLRGRVLSIKSLEIVVDFAGQEYICTLRGALKQEKKRVKNLVTVGDFVLFEPTQDYEGAITFVEPRTSILSRADTLSRQKEHIIASNIDQVLITSSVVLPKIKPFLIDRYIIAAKKGNMIPVVVVNKIDLLKEQEEEKRYLEDLKKAYKEANIPLISVSAKTNQGIQKLKKIMKDKASVFSGQSGVGKSSLINAMTGLHLPVGEAVKKTKKGAHTTTTAHLIPLDFGGFVIDTPGIRSFGVWDIEISEVLSYFHEFEPFSHECRYLNCTHTHEASCGVKKALDAGKIYPVRYNSYVALLESLEQEHKRR